MADPHGHWHWRALGLTMAAWRKASYSNMTNCVEVAWDWNPADGGRLLVRDSKAPGGPVLAFSPAEWAAFTTALRRT